MACDLKHILKIFSALSISADSDTVFQYMIEFLELDITVYENKEQLFHYLVKTFSAVNTEVNKGSTILKLILKSRNIQIPVVADRSS